MKSISYKFGSNESSDMSNQKYRYKPDFKRPMSKLYQQEGKNNKTIDISL